MWSTFTMLGTWQRHRRAIGPISKEMFRKCCRNRLGLDLVGVSVLRDYLPMEDEGRTNVESLYWDDLKGFLVVV